MIYIINPHEHPTAPKLDALAEQCGSAGEWGHYLIGEGDNAIVQEHPDEFYDLLVKAVVQIIQDIRQREAQ